MPSPKRVKPKVPERYKQNVVGHLKPDEMWKAYKGYKYTINMNSVKQSPTMFARRVYESLASGTPVVSNYSKGVVEQFGRYCFVPAITLMKL